MVYKIKRSLTSAQNYGGDEKVDAEVRKQMLGSMSSADEYIGEEAGQPDRKQKSPTSQRKAFKVLSNQVIINSGTQTQNFSQKPIINIKNE